MKKRLSTSRPANLRRERLSRLMEGIQEAAKERRVALPCIPAHCGIPGNEEAEN